MIRFPYDVIIDEVGNLGQFDDTETSQICTQKIAFTRNISC